MALLKSGEIDIAVSLHSLIPKGFYIRKWKEVEPVLIVPDNHPLLKIKNLSLPDIAKYPLIFPQRNRDSRQRSLIEEKFEKEGISYRVIMESGNVELSTRYVEAGIGISFATTAKGLDPLKGRKLRFISLSRHLRSDHISLVYKKSEHALLYIEHFIAQVLNRKIPLK